MYSKMYKIVLVNFSIFFVIVGFVRQICFNQVVPK